MDEQIPSARFSMGRFSPRRWWQRLWSNVVDEAYGLLILRYIFKHRRHLPASSGEFYEPFDALWSGDLQQFFQPTPSKVDLWQNKRLRRRENGQTVWDLEFPSPIPTRSAEPLPVRARLWSGSEHISKRCIVGVDGVVQYHANWFQQLADRMTPKGIDVMMMDAPFNFRRTPKGYRPGQLILNGDLEHQLSVSRHAILDLWTLVANLQAEGTLVGLVGVSFGGWMSLMTSLLADDLAFVTAVAPPVDLERLLEEGGTIVRAVRRGLGHGPLAEDTIRKAVRAVTPLHWTPRLDPRRIHLHAATFDRFVPTSRITELAKRWGAKITMHPTGHMGLTQKSRYIREVAEEILAFWGGDSQL